MDLRLKKLANTIVNYSLNVKEGEKVLINSETMETRELIEYIIEELKEKKAYFKVNFYDTYINALRMNYLNESNIDEYKKEKWYEVDNFDSRIEIVCSTNEYDGKIDNKVSNFVGKNMLEINKIRINERKWVLLRFPSVLDSYKAKMTTNEYYDFAVNTLTYDYKQMDNDIKPLKDLMLKTSKVRITGKDTDLEFSIKDINVIPCTGKMNIPDGEIYTAPVKTSVNGYISYNVDTVYRGKTFKNIKFNFKDGKIIEASCDSLTEDLNEILDTDAGSRYIGEFAIGFNPFIKHPMGDILYDEKIIGSIHFTPGNAYQDAFNGNESAVHWDLVLIQRSEYGGGNIYFDDVLIRENGIFVIDSLKHLNK